MPFDNDGQNKKFSLSSSVANCNFVGHRPPQFSHAFLRQFQCFPFEFLPSSFFPFFPIILPSTFSHFSFLNFFSQWLPSISSSPLIPLPNLLLLPLKLAFLFGKLSALLLTWLLLLLILSPRLHPPLPHTPPIFLFWTITFLIPPPGWFVARKLMVAGGIMLLIFSLPESWRMPRSVLFVCKHHKLLLMFVFALCFYYQLSAYLCFSLMIDWELCLKWILPALHICLCGSWWDGFVGISIEETRNWLLLLLFLFYFLQHA